MDALDVLLVCLRRWYVLLTIMLVALLAGLSLARDRAPIYAASGDFAVIYRPVAPLRPGEVDPRQANPMAAGNGQLLKQALVNDLGSPRTQEALGAPTVLGTSPSTTPNGSRFAVVTNRNDDTVSIQTWGPSRQAVEDTVNAALAASATKAKEIQDRVGAPANGRLTTFVTLPTQVVELPPQSKIKLLLGTLAVGLLVGASLSLIFDRMMTRRRARLRSREQHPQEDDSAPSLAWWRVLTISAPAPSELLIGQADENEPAQDPASGSDNGAGRVARPVSDAVAGS